jgi:hypothetical protein
LRIDIFSIKTGEDLSDLLLAEELAGVFVADERLVTSQLAKERAKEPIRSKFFTVTGTY